jgi:hypothetical protein
LRLQHIFIEELEFEVSVNPVLESKNRAKVYPKLAEVFTVVMQSLY